MQSRPVVDVLSRIGGFSAAVALSTVLGVVSIPLLVTALGAHGWASIALAQTVGQLVGIVVAFGWGAVGPSMIASAPPERRRAMYLTSLVTRGYLFLIGVPIAAVTLYFLSRGDFALSILGGVAYLLPSLGASWYFVGEARPKRLFLCDSLPTALGTVTGVVLALLTGSTYAFLAAQALGSATSALIDALVILRGPGSSANADLRIGTAARSLRGQTHGVTTTLTASLYVSLPAIVVQIFVPAFFPTYVMADRLFRYASIAFAPIQQFFQGWVPERTGQQRYSRMNHATMIGAAFGVIGGAAIAGLSPLASSLLSAGQLHVPWTLSLPLGVAFMFVACSGIIGYACLVVLGRDRSLAVSTVLGALIGAPLVVVFGIFGAPVGVAWAVAVSEFMVAGYQYARLRSALRERTGSGEDRLAG